MVKKIIHMVSIRMKIFIYFRLVFTLPILKFNSKGIESCPFFITHY